MRQIHGISETEHWDWSSRMTGDEQLNIIVRFANGKDGEVNNDLVTQMGINGNIYIYIANNGIIDDYDDTRW